MYREKGGWSSRGWLYDTVGWWGLLRRGFCGRVQLFEVFLGFLVKGFDASFAAKTDQPAIVEGVHRIACSTHFIVRNNAGGQGVRLSQLGGFGFLLGRGDNFGFFWGCWRSLLGPSE